MTTHPTRRHHRPTRVVLAALPLALVALLTNACGGDDSDGATRVLDQAAATAPAREEDDQLGSGFAVDGQVLLFDGEPVRLRGVAFASPLEFDDSPDPPPVGATYQRIVDEFQANVVRLSVAPGDWKHRRAEVMASLDRHVPAALDAGLFVIVDWHSIGWPDGEYEAVDPGSGMPEDAYDSSMALAEDFWRTIPAHLTDRRVAFELWNEPTLLSGEDGEPRWDELTDHWTRLIDAIRGTGSEALLIATANDWAGDLRGVAEELLDDPNVAYAWHVYAEAGLNDPNRWSERLDGLDEVRPVIVTEWGLTPFGEDRWEVDVEEFGVPFRDGFLESRELHSTAWSILPYNSPSLLTDDGESLSLWGEFVRDYLDR